MQPGQESCTRRHFAWKRQRGRLGPHSLDWGFLRAFRKSFHLCAKTLFTRGTISEPARMYCDLRLGNQTEPLLAAHRGQPVMMRTTLFALTWKMILSLLPPSVLPINWYWSRYLLFRRISKSEKKHSTASFNVTRCSKSLSRSKSYSKFDGVNRCQRSEE